MNKGKLQQTIIFIALGSVSSVSVAQEPITVGPADVIPTLNLGVTYDDNIRSEETNTTSDTIITINPSVRAQIDRGVSGFAFDYSLTKGEYLSESSESFLNQTYGASFGWNIVDTHVVSLSANIFDAHDARSPDAISALGADELDEFKDTTIAFNYSYGERALLFGYSLAATLFDKEYTTNRGGPNGTRLDDFDSQRFDARFDVNLSDTFQVNALLGQSQTRFSDAASENRDSDEFSYGVGFNWDVSTTFDLVAAYSKVDRELINENTQNEFKLDRYNLSGTWSPYSYAQVSVDLGQSVSEPSSAGDDGERFVETQSASLNWNHNWTDILSSNLSYANSESDYVGSTTGRVDDADTIALGVGYQFRRWATLNFSLSQASRGGSEESPKSDKNVAQLSVALTL